MPKTYKGLGLTLLYPDSWSITEEPSSENRQGVLLESPAGSFLSINLLDMQDDAEQAIAEAAEAMNAEYDEIESEPYEVEIADELYTGTIQRFYYLDFVVSSKLFTMELAEQRYLVQIQGEDRDMDVQAAVFEAILTSMVRVARHAP